MNEKKLRSRPPITQRSSDKKMKKMNFSNFTKILIAAVNERLGCHVLEIPYLGEENGISMMVFLPPFTSNALENVLTRLTPEALEQALDEGLSREVELQLPRFSFEKTYQMVPVSPKKKIRK